MTKLQVLALMGGACAITGLAGCGGGATFGPMVPSGRQASAVAVKVTATLTPKPVPSPTPRPTLVPTPRPTATPMGPEPLPAPQVPFDVRGQVLVGGVGQPGVTVRVIGAAGAVTPSDVTVSGSRGLYSFFLGGGTYTVTATVGTRSLTRRVMVPFGGQTVDNFDLNL